MKALAILFVSTLTFAGAGYSQSGYGWGSVRERLEPRTIVDVAPQPAAAATAQHVAATVSFAQLRHKVPSQAAKAARSAWKAFRKHDLAECARRFREAVEVDPNYLQAWSDLGRVYSLLNQPQQVIQAFQTVLSIDPHSADAYSFIGAAQASLDQFTEAEAASRQALRLDPFNRAGRFVLGVSLVAQRKNDIEALKLLEVSYDTYPAAHMYAAPVLARQGRINEARDQILSYLPVAPPSDHVQLNDWLARLNR